MGPYGDGGCKIFALLTQNANPTETSPSRDSICQVVENQSRESQVENQITFADFVEADDEVVTERGMTDDEIIAEVADDDSVDAVDGDDLDDEDESDVDELTAAVDAAHITSFDEALKAANGLLAFFETKNVPLEFVDQLRDVQYRMDTLRGDCRTVQTQITDWFSVNEVRMH